MTHASTHVPVLMAEVIEVLRPHGAGCFIDATFGRGGHTAGLLAHLDQDARVIAFDRDTDAIEASRTIAEDPRLQIYHRNFSAAYDVIHELGLVDHVQGVILDLGVSSPQLDDPRRGFSFRFDGPLDMRMDQTQGEPVSAWLNRADERAIADCLWQYGEERKSRQIAAKICAVRATSPIVTTRQLAELVSGIVRNERRIDPATRTFQALRIFINSELEELRLGLTRLLDTLAIAGRCAVITFHSLEDRIVKRLFRDLARPPSEFGGTSGQRRYALVFRKSRVPSDAETARNARARSARLRAIERIA